MAFCYTSLNVECPPKTHGLDPRSVFTGVVLGGGASFKARRSWDKGVFVKVQIRAQSLSAFTGSLWDPVCTLALTQSSATFIRHQANRTIWPGISTSLSLSQINHLCLWSRWPWIFYCDNKMLSNTPSKFGLSPYSHHLHKLNSIL